jgi:hypothetical protein
MLEESKYRENIEKVKLQSTGTKTDMQTNGIV